MKCTWSLGWRANQSLIVGVDGASLSLGSVARAGDKPYALIVAAAEANGCDLIFIASHGRSGVGALLRGSERKKCRRIPVLPCWCTGTGGYGGGWNSRDASPPTSVSLWVLCRLDDHLGHARDRGASSATRRLRSYRLRRHPLKARVRVGDPRRAASAHIGLYRGSLGPHLKRSERILMPAFSRSQVSAVIPSLRNSFLSTLLLGVFGNSSSILM